MSDRFAFTQMDKSGSQDRDHPDPGKRKLSQVSPQQSQWPGNKVRKANTPMNTRGAEKSVVTLKELVDDGHCWRKYGQKDILGAKFPREYYRCTYRDDRGCYATKMVQRVNEANGYKITYKGHHTCGMRTSFSSENIVDASTEHFLLGYHVNDHWGQKESAGVSPFIGGFTVPSRERENSTSSSEIRQDEPTISPITAHKEANNQTSTVSVLSGNSKTKMPKNVVDNVAGSSVPHKSVSCPSGRSSSLAEGTLLRLSVAVQDAEVKKIGICGNGGIGKTTVMKAFYSECIVKRLFDLVLWVSVSRCSSIRKLQNALVQQLSLTMPNVKSDDELASILLQALESRKFVLFMDDVWEYIDLLKVGIPVPSQDNNHKIILTTRTLNICHAMKVDRVIEVDALSREEALKLFQVHVGDVMESREIDPYARAIVEECCGLPLVIKVIGRALRKDNNVLTWKLALKDVLLSNNNSLLKLGYDRLKADEIKSCFLYSALFTEGKAIKYSSLVDYFIEEGFVAGSVSDAHRRAHEIIKYLIDAFLLECSDDGSMVKMHDVIRDLALVIFLSYADALQLLLSRYFRPLLSPQTPPFETSSPTFGLLESSETGKSPSSEASLFVLKAGETLPEQPSDKDWKESRMVCLMDNTFSYLPESPSCSKLVTLFLQRNSNLRAIPPSFFENMSSLQILNLSKTRIKSLPNSLAKLQSLQVLILRNCKRVLFLPPIFGTLKRLLVLDLHGTEICQLPCQIRELPNLRHLNVSFYGTIDQDEYAMLPSQLISKGAISNLKELRELSITVHPGDPRWVQSASDMTSDVSCLELCSLSFHFPEIKHLEYFINKSPAWDHRTLTHFNFIVGHDVKRIISHVASDIENEFNQQERCLRFVDSDDVPDSVKKVISEATALYLDHHLRAHSLTQFGCTNINKLKFCIVRDCPQLKAIINGKNLKHNCFPFLEHLSIHYSWDLRRICVGPIRAGSFSMLRRLFVICCPRLEFILSPSIALSLSSLEELVVEDCQSLKNIVADGDDDIIVDWDYSESSGTDLSETIQDSNSQNEAIIVPTRSAVLRVKVLKLHYLPKLGNIWKVGNWPVLEYISLYNCPRLRNLHLKSSAENTIKMIKTETSWWDALEWEDPALREKLQGRVQAIHADDIWGTM